MKPTYAMLARLSPNRSRRIGNLLRFGHVSEETLSRARGTDSRSFSTARQFLAAKQRNSAQCGENSTWLKYLASATGRNAVKTSAQCCPGTTNQLLYELSYARISRGTSR